MSLTGFLKIDDIPGESKRADHEDEIDVHGVHWKVSQSSSSATRGRGRGRTQARAQIESLTCYKKIDASSPYLALACMRGKSLPEVTLSLRKDSGDAHLDYLVITMTNVKVRAFDMVNDGSNENDQTVTEQVSLSFEEVRYKYTVQADDHSAGDEHEIEYNIASGF